MTPQPDHGHVDLRALLEKLLNAVHEVLHDVPNPTGADVLNAMDNYVSGALRQEAETAGAATLATWHLAQLALAIVEQAGIPEQGSGSGGAYRRLNTVRREMTDGLSVVWQRHEKTIAQELGEI